MASSYLGTDWTGFASMMVPPNGLTAAAPFFYPNGVGDTTDPNLAAHQALSATLNGNGFNNNFMTGSPVEQKMSDSMNAVKQQFDWPSDPIYGPFGGAAHPMMMNAANGVMGHDPSNYLNDYPSTSLSLPAYNYYSQVAAAVAPGNYYQSSDYLQGAANFVNGWKPNLSTKDQKPSITRNSVMNPLGSVRKPPHRTGPGTNNVRVRTHDTYRTVYSDRQRVELEKEFHSSPFITAGRKAELAGQLDLTERQIKIWFQNRRAKERKHNPKPRGHRH